MNFESYDDLISAVVKLKEENIPLKRGLSAVGIPQLPEYNHRSDDFHASCGVTERSLDKTIDELENVCLRLSACHTRSKHIEIIEAFLREHNYSREAFIAVGKAFILSHTILGG